MSRVLLLDEEKKTHDVFEVVGVEDGVTRVRTAFLFEVGEELRLRIEEGGKTRDQAVRVRAHVASADGKITELEPI